MSEYYLNDARERTLYKQIRKQSRKWKMGNALAVAFAVIGVLAVGVACFCSGLHGVELLILLVAVLLVPFLGAMLSLAVARSVGRDILFARYGEKVCLSEDVLIESYTPRFRTIEPASLVENRIRYSAITSIVHESKACRYVICGDVETVKYGAGAEASVMRNERIVLYDYFERMPEFLTDLMKKCNVQIKEEG